MYVTRSRPQKQQVAEVAFKLNVHAPSPSIAIGSCYHVIMIIKSGKGECELEGEV